MTPTVSGYETGTRLSMKGRRDSLEPDESRTTINSLADGVEMLCVKAFRSLIILKQVSVKENVVSDEHITGTSQPILSKRSQTSLPPYSERTWLHIMRILQREGSRSASIASFTVSSLKDVWTSFVAGAFF